MPHIIAFAAQTADGFIARQPGHLSHTWVSPEDTSQFLTKLGTCDWIVAGRTTFAPYAQNLRRHKAMLFTSKPLPVAKQLAGRYVEIDPTQTNPLDVLEAQHAERVAILGGTLVYDYFLEANLLDEVWLTIEPQTFGHGLHTFSRPALLDEYLTLVEKTQLNSTGTQLLHYRRP